MDVDLESGNLIIDLAGFQDKSSAEFDLVAGFVNKKILYSAKRLKFILVEDYSNLQHINQRAAFTTTLKRLARLIGNNFSSFKKSLGLVATKIHSPANVNDLIFSIKVFVNGTRDYLVAEKSKSIDDTIKSEEYSRQIKIVDSLIDGSNYALFRRPNKSGKPWELEPLLDNYKQIRGLIFKKLSFSSPYTSKFEVTADPKTILYVSENNLTLFATQQQSLFKEFHATLIRSFGDKIDVYKYLFDSKFTAVINYCENYIEIIGAVNSYDQLEYFLKRIRVEKEWLSEFHFQIAKTRYLLAVIKKDFSEVEHQIVDFYGWKQPLLSHIKDELNFQKFLEGIVVDLRLYPVQLKLIKLRENFSILDSAEKFKIACSKLRSLGFSESTARSVNNINPTEANIKQMKYFIQGKN